MSALLKAITLFALAQTYAFPVRAQGVIANDAAIVPFDWLGYEYLTLTKSIDALGRNGLFAIRITSNSASQFTFSAAGIAEEYALYPVGPGISVDPSFATSTIPLVSNNGIDPGGSVQTFALGQSRYFAYWDDGFYDSGIEYGNPDITDYYGWVLITRTVSGLQASSDATALGGGIIAGTFIQVPEPSAGMLSLLGLTFVTICASRGRRR